MRRSKLVMSSVAYVVCLSMCNSLTFDSPDLESHFSKQVHLQNLPVKSVYQDHRVKFKVPGTKKV